ncbi:hypothetical protein B0T18DRAFT_387523 [Schizothecium vesticola]|uniref:Prolyl 4-hydroxylase alpha subunit domain-containing protein n=1 Tax=Schizothecium vesticola TaxID=314040 RepID=A0AA40F517_9PEZI|nr:hypothetical protein B0T18DRAFT_387523 [Schizothecium vesticola]
MAFQAGLLNSKKAESLRCAYKEGQPFPHMVIQDVMQDDFLRQVRSEIIRNLRFKFDENKVYRIQRSTHLANISNPDEYTPELLPNLTQLRDALNGSEFRAWVSNITGVGPLSGTRSSMAVNMYLPGDHLLTHDDCNPKSRNRRLSFILYLTDPDEPWLPEASLCPATATSAKEPTSLLHLPSTRHPASGFTESAEQTTSILLNRRS